MDAKYNPLFESFTFRSGVKLENRVVMAPMTNWSSNLDGTVSDAEIDYYSRRAGGVGLVITACTNVSVNGQGFHGEFAGFSDEMIPSLARLATTIKEKGSKAVLQIFHGGRQCPPELVNGDVVSASAVPTDDGKVTPRALSDEEILAIIQDFSEVTRRAIEAGYDGVEIHGANNYLIHQFFSGFTNRREDRWGGNVENRLAFPLAVVDAVKKAVAEYAKGPFLVGYRLSPEEPEDEGITMKDTFVLLDALAKKDLDYIHVSLMDFWSEPRRGVEGKGLSRMELIRDHVGKRVPIMGVGSIQTADDGLKALEIGIPLIALGRELIAEPDWVEKIQSGREEDIATTVSREAQEVLVVPDPLWQAIIGSPGWFPVV
ncbi:NADH-dependent flavin oxidoreductase [Paenibacillus crassostreae]|uniref:NADH-dependent flavin oxidoreductase n=1 Tax=Paenibacillus crassostreae TaxID=1763538 RepID=A0A162KR12_9BACL|nr:NADH-dependent flavin oxidoreductase [Paenibacillus crassostreae]AOZ93194.1 NADH-dependent flavin oxidoreductase [Paenibacillus crassostreae]OAB71715.1 NADH-dependent flavin oxidoreductase [Paenibacillus crassostreae]